MATTAQALAGLDQESFAALVRTSLGPETDPAVWEALTSAAVILRTKSVLGAIDRDILAQLAQANSGLDEVKARTMGLGEGGYQEYLDAKAEQADWRRRTAGFRRLVLARMAQIKDCLAAQTAARQRERPPSPPGTGKTARQHNRAALEQLARAVAEHQDAVTSGEGGEDDDEALWETLTTITAITGDGDEMSLTDWLAYLDGLRRENPS